MCEHCRDPAASPGAPEESRRRSRRSREAELENRVTANTKQGKEEMGEILVKGNGVGSGTPMHKAVIRP